MLGDTQTTGNNKNVLTRSTTGRGGFRKTGPGKLVFQASHDGSPLTYAHEKTTYIDEGEFQCDGTVANSQIELAEVAKISGSGTLKSLVGEGEIGGCPTVTDRFAPRDSSNGQFTFTGTSLTLQGQASMDLVGDVPAVSDSVTGTFAGTPDGTVLTAPIWTSEGLAVRINDPVDGVVATIVSQPSTFADAAAPLPAGQRSPTGNADNKFWITLKLPLPPASIRCFVRFKGSTH